MGLASNNVSEDVLPHHISALEFRFAYFSRLRASTRTSKTWLALYPSPSLLISTTFRWYRNINLFSIDFTPFGLALGTD